MSFGFSIGDFIAVVEFAKRLGRQFVAAPEQFSQLRDDVRNLRIVLQTVSDDFEVLGYSEFSPDRVKDFHGIIQSCNSTLVAVQKLLDCYVELDHGTGNWIHKTRRALKRLEWNPDDIRDLRDRILVNIGLLNTISSTLNGSNIRFNVSKIINNQEIEKRRDLLEWISPIDHEAVQTDAISRRQAETGVWFLQQKRFQQWIDEPSGILVGSGRPGTGKTIMTSIVIESLAQRYFQEDVAIAWFYCKFDRREEQNPMHVLSSILKQLLQQRNIPEDLITRFTGPNTTSLRIDEVQNYLERICKSTSRIFILLDALDEFENKDGERLKLVEILMHLCSAKNISLFVTSRPIPDVLNQFDSEPVDILAHDEDIRAFLVKKAEAMTLVQKDSKLLPIITSQIIEAVDGVFLLAKLHMDSLRDKRTLKSLKSALKDLPSGSSAYDETYERAMKRLQSQLPGDHEQAMNILTWVVCARLPLTRPRLQHALAIEENTTELDEENILDIEDIISVCAGLVMWDQKTDIVRLTHHTTREFLTRSSNHDRWFKHGHGHLAKCCITYLCYNTFPAKVCSLVEYKERMDLYPLWRYAQLNWGDHGRRDNISFEVAASILGDRKKCVAMAQWLPRLRGLLYKKITPMHLSAFFGLSQCVQSLLEQSADPNGDEECLTTPIYFAVKYGHTAVVELLLGANRIDITRTNKPGIHLLYTAAFYNHRNVVRTLLADPRVDVNRNEESRSGRTALHAAIQSGHDKLVNLMIDHPRVNPNGTDNDEHTAFHKAVMAPHEELVKILLDNDRVEPNHQTSSGITAFHSAVSRGEISMIKLLMANKKIEVNLKDINGCTAMHYATWASRKDCIQVLLADYRTDCNIQDNGGLSAVHHAVRVQNIPIIEDLLACDKIDLNLVDNLGRTALHYAVAEARLDITQMLLDCNRLDPNVQDKSGRTPLKHTLDALSESDPRSAAIVKLLQDNPRVIQIVSDPPNETLSSLSPSLGFHFPDL